MSVSQIAVMDPSFAAASPAVIAAVRAWNARTGPRSHRGPVSKKITAEENQSTRMNEAPPIIQLAERYLVFSPLCGASYIIPLPA